MELLHQRKIPTQVSEIFDLLAPRFSLTEEDRQEMLPSNTQRKWNNRVNWACYDLFRAGLLERPKKGLYQINSEGEKALLTLNGAITRRDLAGVAPKFKDFIDPPHRLISTGISPEPPLDEQTPEEKIDLAVQTLDQTLQAELLDHLLTVDPYRFEQIVVDVLFAMGYGGSRDEAATVTKKSGDEGIDGIINEDRLGLDVIYVQAKRWQNTVGRKEIQSFVGALAGQQANKGVLITTSDFAETAIMFAKNIAQKVILINGTRLADLMIEYGVGVSTTRKIELKKIDSDYFDEQ